MKKEIVRVDWIDSCASNTKWTLDEFDGAKDLDVEPVKITTTGVQVLDGDTYIVVAQNYGVNPQQFCSLMSIPKGCITSTRVLDVIEFESEE